MKMEKHGKQNGDNYRNLHINGRRNVFSHPNLEQTIGAINIVVERPKEKGACESQRRRRGATATAKATRNIAAKCSGNSNIATKWRNSRQSVAPTPLPGFRPQTMPPVLPEPPPRSPPFNSQHQHQNQAKTNTPPPVMVMPSSVLGR